MNKISKPISITNKVMADTAKVNVGQPIHRKIDSVKKTANVSSDSYAYNFKREDIEQAVYDTNKLLFDRDDLEDIDGRFEFKIHEGTKRIMVKLVDNKTKEVIKEIPPEKILDLVASIWDLVGILVDERA